MSQPMEVRANGISGAGAYVAELCVSPGQTVEHDATLLKIETEKAVVDVRAPAAGRVESLRIAVNDSVAEEDLLLTLVPLEEAPAATVSSETHASPWIRQLARERQVDLSRVRGSGRFGRILEGDLPARAEAPLPATPPNTPEPSPKSPARPLPDGPTEYEPISRLQLRVGQNVARNWAQIPHVTQFDEADVTELDAFRLLINEEQGRGRTAPRISLLPYIVKAAACALRAFPEFNSSLDGERLILKGDIHIGIAVDVADGLLVPVIRHADRWPLVQLANEMSRLASSSASSTLVPAEMQGGTFTISNLGGAGGTAFTPIINAPEVAILGVSRAQIKPKWNGTAFVPRLMLPLSLSYDHRVVNGVAGARFVSHLAATLSDLRRALL